MVRPPWIYRAVVNPLRAWLEDRRVEPAAYVQQWKAVWTDAPVGDRARRGWYGGAALVGRSRAIGAGHHALSAVRVWTLARWAVSRLLVFRRRRRVAATVVTLHERSRRRSA